MNDTPESPDQRDLRKQQRAARRIDRAARRRRRILQSTAVLPGLVTILNGLAGFAAIHFATKDALGSAGAPNMTIAAWLIFTAMAFDMLDGRLARMTRRTSDFGGQLDSLCDVISFGAAPAVLMLRLVVTVLRGQVEKIASIPPQLAAESVERAVWCVAAIYLACAALRLARFNVENEPDESSHMDFRGLPSPAAAAVVAALVLLFEHLATLQGPQGASTWMLAGVGLCLPVATLAVALLMVSRFRYPHVVNQYIRGRRPFSYLVKAVVVLIAMFFEPYLTIATVVLVFALSGPIGALWRFLRWHRKADSSGNH